MAKRYEKHELLLTVLLIFGTMRVRGAVWPDDENDFLSPLGWLRAWCSFEQNTAASHSESGK